MKRDIVEYVTLCDIAEYVTLCDTCQLVKAEHQRPVGLL
jgi:hypothetical protein